MNTQNFFWANSSLHPSSESEPTYNLYALGKIPDGGISDLLVHSRTLGVGLIVLLKTSYNGLGRLVPIFGSELKEVGGGGGRFGDKLNVWTISILPFFLWPPLLDLNVDVMSTHNIKVGFNFYIPLGQEIWEDKTYIWSFSFKYII